MSTLTRPLAILLLSGGMACAQEVATPTPKPRARMEFLEMGPELFQDRVSAWIEAVGKVCEQLIAKLGIIALAVIAVWRNIITNAEIKGRLDRQGERIDQVAVATIPTSDRPMPVKVANKPSDPANVKEVKTEPEGTT